MPRRTSRAPDVHRIGRAISYPGIDPRYHVLTAIVTKVVVDAEQGIFADVTFQPSGVLETARVGGPYAGGDFGDHCPLRVDDTVLVAVPNGDPDDESWVIGRAWDGADVPPQVVVDHPDDRIVKVRDGQTLRLIASGGGQIRLDLTGAGDVVVKVDAGKILLGDDSGTEPAAKGRTLEDYLKQLQQQINAAITIFNAHVHPGVTVGAGVTGSSAAQQIDVDAPPTLTADKVEVL